MKSIKLICRCQSYLGDDILKKAIGLTANIFLIEINSSEDVIHDFVIEVRYLDLINLLHRISQLGSSIANEQGYEHGPEIGDAFIVHNLYNG